MEPGATDPNSTDRIAPAEGVVHQAPNFAEAFISRAGILCFMGKNLQALRDCDHAFELLAQSQRNRHLYPALFDQKLMLLRLEVEDSLGTLMRHLAVLLIGGTLAGLGLVLSSIALALWIGNQVGSIIGGYALTGAGFLLAGAVLVTVRLSRGIGPQRPLAGRSIKELEKDTRWLKSGL